MSFPWACHDRSIARASRSLPGVPRPVPTWPVGTGNETPPPSAPSHLGLPWAEARVSRREALSGRQWGAGGKGGLSLSPSCFGPGSAATGSVRRRSNWKGKTGCFERP